MKSETYQTDLMGMPFCFIEWKGKLFKFQDLGRKIFITQDIKKVYKGECITCAISRHQTQNAKKNKLGSQFNFIYHNMPTVKDLGSINSSWCNRHICQHCLNTLNLDQIECSLKRHILISKMHTHLNTYNSVEKTKEIHERISRLPIIFLTKQDRDRYYKNPRNKKLKMVDWKNKSSLDYEAELSEGLSESI